MVSKVGARFTIRQLLAFFALLHPLGAQNGAHGTEGVSSGRCSGSETRPMRWIADRSTGMTWVLMRDALHPGGPGLLWPQPEPRREAKVDGEGAHSPLPPSPPDPPVVRAGDRVVVEENTPRIAARLEGTAVAQADAGETFGVRLKIGGKVVRAVAIAPGRAALLADEGERR